MPNINNNNAFGTQSRIQSPSRQRVSSRKKQRIGQGSGEHSTASLTKGQSSMAIANTRMHNESLDATIPFPKLSFITSAFLVAVLSIVTFWNSFHGDFVFDDLEAIVKNQDVRSETPLWNVFQHDFWGQGIELKESHKSYRPLTVLTFR